ncbi:MAG: hypothetical protein GY870_05690, partial [archaeon]|nr:hypothetical protein [archaeon]
ELVNWIVGSEYKRGQEKKLKILFDPKESDYHLMTIGISEIKNIEMELGTEQNPDLIDEMKFKALDTIKDDCIDTISFDLESTKLPPKGTPIIATVEYTQDLKEPIKKKVLKIIYSLTTALVVMNFVLSFLLVGNVTFWL